MDLVNIMSLATQPESNTLEFKSSLKQIRPAMETLCGFLNGQGGTVLIGIGDQGKILGQTISDRTKQEIARELSRIEPHAELMSYYVPVNSKQFIVVLQASPSSYKPHVYDGRAFERVESTTRRVSQHYYEQLLVQRNQLNHAWEDAFAVDYTMDMLDEEEVKRTVYEGIQQNRLPTMASSETTEATLSRFKLLHQGKLRRAAIVLFAKENHIYYKQCMIKMARFAGVNKYGELLDSQHIEGNAFKLLAEAENFLRRHLAIASTFQVDNFKRIDQSALPFPAIREALINALCHRDYENKSAAISLAIYDDRLEVWSYGKLPVEIRFRRSEKGAYVTTKKCIGC